MRCVDCRWATVLCKVKGRNKELQVVQTGLTIRCKKGHWLDSGGKERIYHGLRPILEAQGMIKEYQRSCSDYKESQVPIGTWQD